MKDTGEKVLSTVFCNTNLTESGCDLTLEAENVLVSMFNSGEEKS